MIRIYLLSVVCAAGNLLSAQPTAQEMTPTAMSARAGELARSGKTEPALELYASALAKEPGNTEIRLDYATVLGWAERYPDSIREFESAIGAKLQDQPDWALVEFSRSQLFGDRTAAALVTLNELIGRGNDSEIVLCRKAMALRWLNRPKEAEKAYKEALRHHPTSTMAMIGVIYSQADQNQLGRALAGINTEIAQDPDKWEFVKVKGQILNWMGRHREALQVLHKIDYVNDRELLEARVSGARWGGRPAEARNGVKALVQQYPDAPAVRKLDHDMALEYGNTLAASVRTASDNDGLTDHRVEQAFSMHAGPANRFDFAVELRRLNQDETTGWRRASLGWSGQLTSRFSGYASMNQVGYREGPSKLFRDGALSYALNDRVRISGGAGSAAVDAYRAVQNRVRSDFYYGEMSAQPTPGISLSAKFAHTNYSDGVERNRFDFDGLLRVHTSRKLRVDIGGSAAWMSHTQETVDFFSPEKFRSVLGKVQLSGKLSKRLEYTTQIGAGIQHEGDYGLQSPLVATGTLWAKLTGALALQFDAARSTSSMERINAGRPSYARYVLAGGLVYRFQALGN